MYLSSLWGMVSFLAYLYMDSTVLWIAYSTALLLIQFEKCSLLSIWKAILYTYKYTPTCIYKPIHVNIDLFFCNLGSSIWYEGNYFNMRHAVLIFCLHNKLAKILHAFIKLKFSSVLLEININAQNHKRHLLKTSNSLSSMKGEGDFYTLPICEWGKGKMRNTIIFFVLKWNFTSKKAECAGSLSC